MSKEVAIVIAGALFVSGMLVDHYIGKPASSLTTTTMAYGYVEKDNVWNRIRVDEKGFVMCSK